MTSLVHDAIQTGTCAFKLEKPKVTVFAGNVRDYAIFRSDFKHAIEAKYTKRDAITLLRTYLRDKPLELIRHCGTRYYAIYSITGWTHTFATPYISSSGPTTPSRKLACPVVWTTVTCCPQ